MKKILFAGLFVCLLFAGGASAAMRIAVLDFANNAPEGSDLVARALTDMFTTEMANSGTFEVFERTQLQAIAAEQKLGQSGLVDVNSAVQLGKLVGVEAVILGAVTEFTEQVSGGAISVIAFSNRTGRVTLDVRIINTTTGAISFAVRETGTADQSATGFAYGGVAFAEAQIGGIRSAAAFNAVQKITFELRRRLGGVEHHVLQKSGNEIIIDIGSTLGAKKDGLYVVYGEGRSITGHDGQLLGMEKMNYALLKVTEAHPAFSKCIVVAEGGDIKNVYKGDLVEPVQRGPHKDLKYAGTRAPKRDSAALAVLYKPADAPGSGNLPVQPTATSAPAPAAAPTPAAAPAPAPAAQPAPLPAQQPAANAKPAFDPNKSDQTEVISTYPIDMGKANIIGTLHRNGVRLWTQGKGKDALAMFEKAFEEYSGNYLSAYWAGTSALKWGKRDLALEWFNKTLAINPKYEPAIKQKELLEKKKK